MNEEQHTVQDGVQKIEVICRCGPESGKVKRGPWGVFWKIFAGFSGFFLSLFTPFFVLIFMFVILAAIGASAGDTEKERSSFQTNYLYGREQSERKLLQVAINGIILGDTSDGSDIASILSGGATYGYEVKEILKWAATQQEIKGVVLSINSPGGTVVGAHAIADAVHEYRERTKRPVYAHIGGIGASGAYWSAVSADKVFADVGSISGSIGVIMGSVLYYDNPVAYADSFGASVETTNGIKEYDLSVGKGKDFGNPFREPTEEELRVYRASLENEYSRFVGYVSERRGIPVEAIRNQIGAFVYDTTAAEQLKLIDGTKMQDETYEAIADVAGLGDDYQVVGVKGVSLFEQIFAYAHIALPQAASNQPNSLQTSSFCAPRSVVAFYGELTTYCR